jgi:hypothetical protein
MTTAAADKRRTPPLEEHDSILALERPYLKLNANEQFTERWGQSFHPLHSPSYNMSRDVASASFLAWLIILLARTYVPHEKRRVTLEYAALLSPPISPYKSVSTISTPSY